MNNEYNIMKQKIRFKLTDRYLVLLICFLGYISTVSAQSHKISGVVVDEGKSPIIGATIQVKGAHFKEAIKLAALTEKYDYVAKVCRRCSLYYQKYGHFDEALEMERKAYASQLMLNDQTGDTKIILSSALGVFGVMSLLLGLLWKKNKFVYSQLTTFKDEMLRKEAESDKLMLQCNYLEEKYQSLQQHIYESSPVVSKVRQIKERSVSPSKVVSFSEKDWSELLRLQEGVYGLVSKLKEISPKLTEEDLRVCAFLREGIQPACFADLMKLTVETLTRRISRIKTEKLMLVSSKESLEDYIKSL